ncbi:hypothetical protein LSCM1_02442 [Leishmania martiniquensis]|uniref:Uncharacterized protein n=1 Tax=Leishmania martiniquensis TaxID=1580590 RepID=A0A836FSK5_9TRYP|nr:hypothetical protein LSCM1_02442 [Leishmania martiniquensis]
MTISTSHVKQLLSTARVYRRPDMLDGILRQVSDTEKTSGRASAELRVLCAEVAVELKQWSAAAELLKGIGSTQETRLLAVRRAFCEVLLTLHDVDESSTLAEEEKAQEYMSGAARALQALAEAVDVWPDSLNTVLTGIRVLWVILSPLLTAGHEADVCDAVAFLAALHQQLRIGGGYTLVQWLVRAALCFRAAERHSDALTRFSAALESAATLSNQRLFVQVLRLAAGAIFMKEKTTVSSKARSDLLPSYRSRPVHFAVLLTSLVLGGYLEMEACRDDMQNAYSALGEGLEAAQPPPEPGPSAPRGKKKQAAVKPPHPIRLVDVFAITQADVIDEVKSDMLFCISLHGTLSPEQVEEMERRCHSSNLRVRSFARFTRVIRDSHLCGLSSLFKCTDASSLSASHRAELRTLSGELVDVLKNASAIDDESERQHTMRTGASLLWNLILPFLQTGMMGDVQAALTTVMDVSQAFVASLRRLFLQVATQQCCNAYDEDNRSVLHHLLPMIQRECERGEVDGAASAFLFRQQWLQHKMAIRDEHESSLTSAQDRCLFALEQARSISNPLRRIPVIKTAFRHLPPIVQEGDATLVSTEAAEPPKAALAHGILTTRRSTVQLYRELLDLCMQDLSSSLYAVAMAVAEALRNLPSPLPGAVVTDIEEVQAAASLHAATILARQLEEAEAHGLHKDVRSVELAGTKTASAEVSEGRLAALLTEAARRGAELENRLSGSGGWIAANACVAFLNWKRASYARGEYHTHLLELLELQKLYAALFEHDEVQDGGLLSDLTVSAVLGLVAEYLVTAKPSAGSGTPLPERQVDRGGFDVLVHCVRTCASCEPSNVQLRRAHAICLEALHIIPAVKQKWFLAMLSPAIARLVGDKTSFAVHPQEQLLILLGVLAGPSAVSDKTVLLRNDVRTLLRKDPCVRLCAWVAAVAVRLRQEEVALECCEMAERLYATNRLGWGSLFEVQLPSSPAGGASAAVGKTAEGGSLKKVLGELVLVQLDVPPAFPKPDPEDWEAYAELLSIKAQIGVQHLDGLNIAARNRAVQLLLTNCVNSAIAAVQGPAASKVERITSAYRMYYAFLRTTRISLETATFVLPSLRMLLSKALLAQLPKRSWNDSFMEVVYQLSCVLVYVSGSSEQDDDVRQLGALLRSLRELLLPRYQKPLKAWEVTVMCRRYPSVGEFLQTSKNMEAELQARGWMIVAQASEEPRSKAEAFALALASSQGGNLATAQCLFEHAYASSLQRADSTPLSEVTSYLRQALRTLEGLPETAPLLKSDEDTQRWSAALANASLTGRFLRSQAEHQRCLHDDDLAGEDGVERGLERRTPARKASAKVHTTKVIGVTFYHAFLGLRIVSLLFRMAPHHSTLETLSGCINSGRQTAPPVSRRDCANVMLDYISSLWHLSAWWLREGAAGEDAVVLQLPASDSLFYGYTEPPSAAQRLRRYLSDEELNLNTAGLWECLLDVGDYLAHTGDEPHAFMIYAWVRFAAALAFGDAEGDSRCALVQRVCNWKMCAVAATSGLSDCPYTKALSRLADARSLVEEAVKRDLERKCVSPSWEAAMVVGECEVRIQLGQTEGAAALAQEVLCRGLECTGWNTTVIRARALRIRARHEALCFRYRDALQTLQEALQLIGATTSSSAPTVISARLWAELCSDRLAALVSEQSTAEAVQWASTVREQLHQWRAAAAASAVQTDTVLAACVRVELEDALEIWVSCLFTTITQQFPLDDDVGYQAAYSTRARHSGAAGELLGEVLLVSEGSTRLRSRLCITHAQWHVRGRVTPEWLAQHGANVDDVRARFLVLLNELRVLDELSLCLQTARSSIMVGVGSLGQVECGAAAATGMSFWQGAVLYWSAIDRVEASALASCLLAAFRQLSMEDLGLPTSKAPAHCEREVLRFIRGAASFSASSVEVGGEPKVEAQATKVGARWHSAVTHETEELRQALQHYSVGDASAYTMADVSAVPALLEKAAAYSRQWPHTRLTAAILVAATRVEVLQRLENQLEQRDNLAGEELRTRTHALLTEAWSRERLAAPRLEKPSSRMRKSAAAGKLCIQSDPSLTKPARPLTEEEEALLHRVSLGIQSAVYHGHLDLAAQLSVELSHLAVLLEIPHIAAAAAEQAQANQLVGLLWRSCVHGMMDSPEGRLWRQMQAVPPLFTNSSSYTQKAKEALSATPMERCLRSCTMLCAEREVAETPRTATEKGVQPAEVSPFVVDGAVLSVAVDADCVDFCIISLRHPDGVVEGRRRHVPQQTWATLADTLQRTEALKEMQLGSTDGGRTGASDERATAEDLSNVMEELNSVAVELFEEFRPSIREYCEKTPLYLCLAPQLQPFPWELTCVLSDCPVLLRELSAAVVVSKTGELRRSGKRASQQPPKQAGSHSTKGVLAGPLVCLIDLFGDRCESVAATCGADHTKSKVSPQFLVTCSSAGAPPDAVYLAWMLRDAAPGALVVNTCGSLTDALPWSCLASLTFTQLNGALIIDGASNAKSQQREERLRLLGSMASALEFPRGSLYPRWMTQALFLLRGAKFVAATAFACSPSVADALARRCLYSASSGKAVVEQLRGKTKDTKAPLVTLYGVIGNGSSKGKA